MIVYISNWSVTFSKEWNTATNEPMWVEFKITCSLDQIPNAGVWMYYLGEYDELGENDKLKKPTFYHEKLQEDVIPEEGDGEGEGEGDGNGQGENPMEPELEVI